MKKILLARAWFTPILAGFLALSSGCGGEDDPQAPVREVASVESEDQLLYEGLFAGAAAALTEQQLYYSRLPSSAGFSSWADSAKKAAKRVKQGLEALFHLTTVHDKIQVSLTEALDDMRCVLGGAPGLDCIQVRHGANWGKGYAAITCFNGSKARSAGVDAALVDKILVLQQKINAPCHPDTRTAVEFSNDVKWVYNTPAIQGNKAILLALAQSIIPLAQAERAAFETGIQSDFMDFPILATSSGDSHLTCNSLADAIKEGFHTLTEKGKASVLDQLAGTWTSFGRDKWVKHGISQMLEQITCARGLLERSSREQVIDNLILFNGVVGRAQEIFIRVYPDQDLSASLNAATERALQRLANKEMVDKLIRGVVIGGTVIATLTGVGALAGGALGLTAGTVGTLSTVSNVAAGITLTGQGVHLIRQATALAWQGLGSTMPLEPEAAADYLEGKQAFATELKDAALNAGGLAAGWTLAKVFKGFAAYRGRIQAEKTIILLDEATPLDNANILLPSSQSGKTILVRVKQTTPTGLTKGDILRGLARSPVGRRALAALDGKRMYFVIADTPAGTPSYTAQSGGLIGGASTVFKKRVPIIVLATRWDPALNGGKSFTSVLGHELLHVLDEELIVTRRYMTQTELLALDALTKSTPGQPGLILKDYWVLKQELRSYRLGGYLDGLSPPDNYIDNSIPVLAGDAAYRSTMSPESLTIWDNWATKKLPGLFPPEHILDPTAASFWFNLPEPAPGALLAPPSSYVCGPAPYRQRVNGSCVTYSQPASTPAEGNNQPSATAPVPPLVNGTCPNFPGIAPLTTSVCVTHSCGGNSNTCTQANSCCGSATTDCCICGNSRIGPGNICTQALLGTPAPPPPSLPYCDTLAAGQTCVCTTCTHPATATLCQQRDGSQIYCYLV